MTEMQKLAALLIGANIPYRVDNCWGTPQICYPNTKPFVCDVICHDGSYGHEEGLLEIMGLVDNPDDDVEGWLTAEDIFARIQKHWETNKKAPR